MIITHGMEVSCAGGVFVKVTILTQTGSEAAIQRICVLAMSSVRIGLNMINANGMAECFAHQVSANSQGQCHIF